MKVSKSDRDESIKQLKEWIRRGDTVYTVLRHVSQSGMMRHISVILITNHGKRLLYPDWHVSRILGYPLAKDQGIRVGGCGMDMGFHVVYSLSMALFKEGYALDHRWI